MNSNHQLLASSPSAARARGEDSVVDTVDSDSDDDEERARDQNAATAAATAGTTVAAVVAVEVVDELGTGVEDDTTPLRPQSSSPTEEATRNDDVEAGVHSVEEPPTDTARQNQDGSSIQTV
ncbi:uncharacterized protein IUM83_10857 [Phytophthora cinnamomi]|uniref:uncharacterized protein n=2 Tax=Phytophthora cinnamomi TaxID=4785 RepID=UPI00355A79E2|nr:hypothetical protein IUM83_10857 [Phytophthora cinnamomi]